VLMRPIRFRVAAFPTHNPISNGQSPSTRQGDERRGHGAPPQAED
jgi:hypothetical protein